MDLRTQPSIYTEFSLNETTGDLTITVKDAADTTVLGTILIENDRVRSLTEMLAALAKERMPDTEPRTGYRTKYFASTGKAETIFG